MNKRIFLLSFCFILMFGITHAQKHKGPKSIIRENVGIKKYHNKEELERMPKGELLGLYTERIESLVKLLPYIAFATKPGVTLTSLGIPDDKENNKVLDNQFEATDDFLSSTREFHERILPYSDTSKLIAAILFYEDMMKSLHEFSEYH
ncbi:hypothetical protein [Gaetbulibacter aestuarii]|uniref:Uncharacterized protein n=1 Tax=Gaetbulibacter aestuarii TaxID=1502358 RepID=A0ABW7MXX1_9FLAO